MSLQHPPTTPPRTKSILRLICGLRENCLRATIWKIALVVIKKTRYQYTLLRVIIIIVLAITVKVTISLCPNWESLMVSLLPVGCSNSSFQRLQVELDWNWHDRVTWPTTGSSDLFHTNLFCFAPTKLRFGSRDRFNLLQSAHSSILFEWYLNFEPYGLVYILSRDFQLVHYLMPSYRRWKTFWDNEFFTVTEMPKMGNSIWFQLTNSVRVWWAYLKITTSIRRQGWRLNLFSNRYTL